MKIIFNQMGAKEWNSLLGKSSFCAFQQDWSYGAILRQLGAGVDRAVIYKDDTPLAMVQIIQRKFLKFFDVSTIHRGPVFIGDVSKEDQELIMDKLLKEYPRKFKRFCIITPEENSDLVFEKDRRQIYTGYTTNVLDLTKSEEELWGDLSSKNRNKIRKAEKNNLKITIADHKHKHMDFILEEELKQQGSVGYSGLPPDFTLRYGELSSRYAEASEKKNKIIKQSVITFFAYKDGAKPHDLPIAGGICLLHGHCATYHIGWNGAEGRKLQAMNYILWQMMKKLKMINIQYLDLGGLNTDKAPDIARFKLSFGGKVKSLPGSFL